MQLQSLTGVHVAGRVRTRLTVVFGSCALHERQHQRGHCDLRDAVEFSVV